MLSVRAMLLRHTGPRSAVRAPPATAIAPTTSPSARPRNLRGRALGLVVGAMAVAGGARTALRGPVWRSNMALTLSILEDSPRAYVGPMIMATIYPDQPRPPAGF